MSTTETIQQQGSPAPNFNLEAMEREVAALVAQGTKDLEIELCEERIAPYIVDITKPIA